VYGPSLIVRESLPGERVSLGGFGLLGLLWL
jgi:hypothetical protein